MSLFVYRQCDSFKYNTSRVLSNFINYQIESISQLSYASTNSNFFQKSSVKNSTAIVRPANIQSVKAFSLPTHSIVLYYSKLSPGSAKPKPMETETSTADNAVSIASGTKDSASGDEQKSESKVGDGPTTTTVVPPKLSAKEKLKQAVKDYGLIVPVFHISISLLSLGFFYALVSSGLDVVELMRSIGISESLLQSKTTQGASTFVVAYAIHKIFAPVRIGITLTASPVIVHRLRKLGFLKVGTKAEKKSN